MTVEAGPGLCQQPRHGVEADLEAGHVGVELAPEADREHERLE